MFFDIVAIPTIQSGKLGIDAAVLAAGALDGGAVEGDAANEDGIDAELIQAQALLPDRAGVGIDTEHQGGVLLLCIEGKGEAMSCEEECEHQTHMSFPYSQVRCRSGQKPTSEDPAADR